MSSPRKFAEKIALIQQKQAEGDAAFNTIIYEVEAAKHRADHVSTTQSNLNVPLRKYEKPFEECIGSNGMINSDNNHYNNQSLKMENNNGSDRLLQLPDNTSWRRTHSDSSLHQPLMPTGVAHYNGRYDNENNDQQMNYNINEIKYEPTSYDNHYQHLQQSNIHYQPYDYYDLNNNNNYANDPAYVNYSSIQIASTSLSQPPATTNNTHTLLGPRSSGGNTNSNVLMLPPSQHPRGSGGGSLPDLRTGNIYNNQQVSYSTVSSPPTSTTQQFFRSSSPQQNGGDGDLFALGPQQRLPSSIGPLKTSPSIHRRHSPIGEVRQSSPRRQNSPSPDVSSTQQPNHYRVEPSSPQSQSSYSPQNSPHLLSSPANEHAPFSPSQSTDNQQQQQHQPYFTLPNQFDQITLDHNFYTQQQQPTSPLSHHKHNHSLPSTPIMTNDNNLNYLGQTNFYSSFMDDLPPAYCHTQTAVTVTTNVLKKSPTIPNIILTDADSSKLDLSKELGNDFSSEFDSLIDSTDLQLNTDDFLLNVADLSVDSINCDDVFRSMER